MPSSSKSCHIDKKWLPHGYPQNGNKIPTDADKPIDLENIATEIRKDIIKMLERAGSGHVAGALGTADILAVLYFSILNINPKDPTNPGRDRFILSNGHICPVLYATLARKGFFPKEQLKTLRQFSSMLQGHPHVDLLPGIENVSGPLGLGLSFAIGCALSAKMDQASYRVFCMTSDGELNEGQTWEAAMFAGNRRLNNLTWLIDRNNIQIGGYTEDIMPLEPLRAKLEAFNWHVIEIDGHNFEEIISACNMAKSIWERPTCIIAHTIPGKGVDFMENKFEWHGVAPNKEEAKVALRELRSLSGKINYAES